MIWSVQTCYGTEYFETKLQALRYYRDWEGQHPSIVDAFPPILLKRGKTVAVRPQSNVVA